MNLSSEYVGGMRWCVCGWNEVVCMCVCARPVAYEGGVCVHALLPTREVGSY